MIDPSKAALFIPPKLSPFKNDLFERVGKTVGRVVRYDFDALARLSDDIVPIVGCTPELRPLIDGWLKSGRAWVYWDRGYCRRVFATWLPRGENGGFYRWHVGSYQLKAIRSCPDDRWRSLLPGNKVDPRPTELKPWRKAGKHIVVACPTPTYERFHKIEGWTDRTLRDLARITTRQIVVRDKESKRPLQDDLDGAHCLVAHGSNTAVESVIMGCPVVVDATSAAALVGITDLKQIEKPAMPDRAAWLNALAYSQFSERELVDGTLWRLMR